MRDVDILLSGTETDRSLMLVPVTNRFGSAIVTVNVDDGGASTNLSFLLTVNSVNDLPSISALGDHLVRQGDRPFTTAFRVDDDETPAVDLRLSAASSNPELVPADAITFDGTTVDRTVTIVPAAERTGTALITVTVTDADGGSADDTLRLNVTGRNQPSRTYSFEAESGLLAAPMQIASNAWAFGGAYVFSSETDQGTVSIELEIPEPDIYVVWCRVYSPNAGLDSFYVSVDGQAEDVYDTVRDDWTSAWRWTQVNGRSGGLPFTVDPRSFLLTPEKRTLIFRARERGTALDRVLITNDRGLVPQDEPATPVGLTLDPLNDLTIDEDAGPQTLTLTGIGPGAENQTLMVSATSSNPALIPPPLVTYTSPDPTGTLSFAPAHNASGTSIISVQLGSGPFSITNFFVVTIQAVNDAPTLDPIPNLVTRAGLGLQTVPLTGISPGASNESQTISVSVSNSNPDLLTALSVRYTNSSNTALLSFIPSSHMSGQAVVTVQVDDGALSNNIINHSFSVTVEPPLPSNGPPTLSNLPAATTTTEDTPLVVPLTVGDELTHPVRLTVLGTSADPTLLPRANIVVDGTGAQRTLTLAPVPARSGTTVVTLVASDGVFSNTATFVFTVAAVNDPPTLDPVPDVGLADNKQIEVGLSGITSGAPNENQSLTVTATSSDTRLLKTVTVTYRSPDTTGKLTIRAADHVAGVAFVTVTVNDRQATNNLFKRTCAVFVRDDRNAAPTITAISDRVTSEDTPTPSIPFTVSDATTPANLLTLSARSSNPILVPTNNIVWGGSNMSRTVSIAPAPGQYGSSRITILVTDTNFGAGSTSFLLTVNPVNDPPAISPLSDWSTSEGVPLGPVTFTVGDPDTPAHGLTLTALSSNQGLVPNANIFLGGRAAERALLIIPAAGRFGSATLTFTVSDGVASTSQNVSVRVDARLRIDHAGTNVMLNWTAENAILQQAERVAGPWQDILPSPVSPYLIPPSGIRFYRLRQ